MTETKESRSVTLYSDESRSITLRGWSVVA